VSHYGQAIVHNGTLYTSGQIAINPKTSTVEATSIEDQTEQVMQNLNAILEEAGTSFENVIKTTCFLKNMSDFATFNTIYANYFVSKPARSCVAVKELPKDVLVEVEVIAALIK
jgi:2-iminobutanoate/2-iminopropanoate deaminase